jgi:hypothetical protein
MASQLPAISDPYASVDSLQQTLLQVKEAIEVMSGQRGQGDGFITEEVRKQVGENYARVVDDTQLLVNEFEAIASRVEVIEAEVESMNGDGGTLSTRITNVEQAITNQNGAIGSKVTTIESKANGATATGNVYLRTTAGGSGATAAYEVYLTANNAGVGMRMEATAGGGRIVFTASNFMLRDPSYNGGNPVTVFGYDGTRFAFNVPVLLNGNVTIDGNATINGNALVTGTVTGAKIIDASLIGQKLAANAVSNSTSNSASTVQDAATYEVAATLTLRGGARIVIISSYLSLGSSTASFMQAPGDLTTLVGGTVLANVPINYILQDLTTSNDNNVFYSYKVTPLSTTDQVTYVVPSDGTYTFYVRNGFGQGPFPKRLVITVIELFK